MPDKKIVVFDDEIDILEFLKYNLGREGFHVTVFPSPVFGFEYLAENTPDIILSDWLMPDMDGLEFCQKLKKDPNLSKIPLIMISCKGEDSAIVQALESGADDYLVKPFLIKELITCINRIIQKKTP